jgi:hypothetical protein
LILIGCGREKRPQLWRYGTDIAKMATRTLEDFNELDPSETVCDLLVKIITASPVAPGFVILGQC